MTQGRPELELVFPTRDDPVAPPNAEARVEPRRLASRAEHDLLPAPVTIHAAGGFINLAFDRLHSVEKLSLNYIL